MATNDLSTKLAGDALNANRVIWRALAARAPQVIGGSLLMMGHQTGESLVPVMIGLVIDTAVTGGDFDKLVPGIAGLALVFAFLSNSWRFGARLLQRAAKGAEHDLRVALTRKILDPAGGADAARLSGELLNIATADAERVGRLAQVTATAAGAFAALAVTTIVLLRISIPLGLLVLFGTIPLIALIQFLGRTLERHSRFEQAGAARAAGIANDLVAGLRVLKGIGAEEAAVQRYRKASRESLQATVRAANTQAIYQGINLALTGSFLALVALVGGRLAADGKISIGDLIAALGLTQFLIGPMYRLTNVGANLARGRASAARIADVLAAPAVIEHGGALLKAPVQGSLAFDSVSYASLAELNFAIEAGEFVGIVASEPGDALALLDCLSGAGRPTSGRISVDGVPIVSISPEELHAAVLVCPHDAFLFAETMLANIRPGASYAELQWAVEASAADEVADNLAEGIETMISTGGRSLSGGQRQRVGLARALAANPPILVLHDPTTAVDSVTESRIAAGIRDARLGQTTILVTTSPALLALTGRVIFLESGRIVSQAGHAELIEARSEYRDLVLS